jgi:serine/threonine-protein kinase HipA
MRIVRERSTAPLLDAQQLLRWIGFVLLAGNSDGHGKNLSLLYEGGARPRLAPFYDLVCTRVYPGLDRFLAMGIGGQHDPGRVGRLDWQRLASAVDVGPRLVLGEVERLANVMPAAFEEIAAAHQAAHGHSPAIQRIRRTIATQCRRSRQLLRG